MGILTRFSLRRERVGIPVWIISIIGGIGSGCSSLSRHLSPGGAGTGCGGRNAAKPPAMISMIGPAYGIRNYHMGAVMAHQMLLFTAVAVAIMNILLGVRHTRNDEELGGGQS